MGDLGEWMSSARFLAPVSVLALITAVPALAASFTVNTLNDTTPRTLNGNAETGTVTSSGELTVTNADAISGTDALSIENAGTIYASGTSSAAINLSGTVGSITNSGSISTEKYNVIILGGTLTGAFLNDTAGVITSSADSTLFVDTFGANGTFTNRGTITNTSAGPGDSAVLSDGMPKGFVNAAGALIQSNSGFGVSFRGGVGADGATNAGTIIGGNNVNQAAFNLQGAGGSITNTATGVIRGTGGIIYATSATVATVVNAGTVESTLSNGTAIALTQNDDKLTLMTGSTTTGLIDGRANGGGGDELIFDGAGASALGIDKVLRFEKLTKTGSGSWTLNGDNGTAMQAAISAGLLSVNGNLASTNVTLTGGTLAGTGSVGNVTLGSGSTISPGNSSVDTLTVADIAFSSGSMYQLDVLGKTSDKIVATGTLTFPAGAIVNINGATCGINTYTIITANGGFAGGTNAGNFLATGTASPTQFSIVGNDVLLTIDGGVGRLFTGYTNTANQGATAVALDALGCSSQPYAAQLAALTDAQVPAAMDALSGEGHAAIAASMVQNAVPVSGSASTRIDEVFDAAKGDVIASGNDGVASLLDPGVFEGLDVWASGYGSVMLQAGNGNAAATQNTTGGLLFGTDRQLTEDWIGGLLGGFGVTGIQADATNGHSLDATLGAYAGGQLGVVRVKAGAAYSQHFISTARSIVFPGVNDTVSASYQAGTAQGFVEIGTDIEAGATTITPFGKLEGVSHATDAFTETGGQGALATAASVANALFVTIGVGAEQSFVLDDDMVVKARGSIGWRHAFAGQVQVANAFAGGGPFTIASAGIASDVLLVSLGAAVDIDDRTSLDVSYDGSLGSGLGSGAVKVTLSGRF